MRTRKVCEGCKNTFYADGEDILYDNYYCSFCLPFMQKCVVCGQIFKTKSEVLSEIGICKGCRDEFKINTGSNFASPWLIIRFKVFQRDAFTCRYCGRSPLEDKVKLHCDHIVPRVRGGEDELENLVTACSDCNSGKVDILLEKDIARKIIQRKLFI